MTSSDVNPADEARTEGRPQKSPPVARRSGRSGVVAVSLVISGLILLLGFAPASRLVARDLPQSPPRFVPVPVVMGSEHGKATAVRDVPVGLPQGARIRTAGDVLPYAVAALGPLDALAFMAVLKSSSDLGLEGRPIDYISGHVEYPYRYAAFDAVLNKVSPARFAYGVTALGAALTVLAVQPPTNAPGLAEFQAIENAGPAAYSVLNRARAANGCAPQLDLLLLVAADEDTSSDVLRREEQRTESACPHDPTPGWLVGQSQLRNLPMSLSATNVDAEALAALQSAIATFRRLAAAYPDDTGVLTGLGDGYLRAGTHLRSSEPFAARQDLKLAIVEYNRASALGGARDAVPGLARALIGLGEPAEAARTLQPFASASASPGPLLEILIAADEATHDFGAAQTAARHLDQLGTPAYPDRGALFPQPTGNSVDPLDDASFPLSSGADRLTSLTTALQLPGRGAGGSVQDLSFIPGYRGDPEVTGTQPDSASWTWRRDALLDGHAAQALAQTFRSLAGWRCLS